jgi:hypothetical protein
MISFALLKLFEQLILVFAKKADVVVFVCLVDGEEEEEARVDSM